MVSRLKENFKFYFTNLIIAISNAKNNSAKITNHFQIWLSVRSVCKVLNMVEIVSAVLKSETTFVFT